MKWLIPVAVILIVVVSVIWLWPGSQKDIPVTEEILESKKGNVKKEFNKAVELQAQQKVAPEKETSAKKQISENESSYSIEEALESMKSSLGQVDPRTPEMSEPYQREMPTEEELADPALYEAYELRQTKKIASIYAGVKKEIPVVRERIEAARLSGNRSSEEIAEAEEALAKMEALSEKLLLENPDLDAISEEEIQKLQSESTP